MHNREVSSIFSEVGKRQRGYQKDQVDVFMERARQAFDEEAGASPLSSDEIRNTGFDLAKYGYSLSEVDAALERLENAFALRERDRAIAQIGAERWREQARQTALVIVKRLRRPAHQKFNRGGVLSVGYDCDQVDAFADEIITLFTAGSTLTVDEVRSVVFRRKSRGYSEQQVDALLDRTVAVLLAIS